MKKLIAVFAFVCLFAIPSFAQQIGGGGGGGLSAIACVATPGNTVGAYRQQCQTSGGAVYACNNSSGCSVAADWVSVTGSGSFTYPGAGVANSTGSAWGTSYTVGTSANNLVQLTSGDKFALGLGFTAATTSLASLNVASGVAPTAPNSGDLWNLSGVWQIYDGSTTHSFMYRDTSLALAQTPLTTSQDLLYDNAGALGRLPIVTSGQCLGNTGGVWASLTCSGGSNTTDQTSASTTVISMAPGGTHDLGSANVAFTTTGTITHSSGTDTGVFYTGYLTGQRVCYAGTGITIGNWTVANFQGSTCTAGTPPTNGTFWESASIQVTSGVVGTVTDMRAYAPTGQVACGTNLTANGTNGCSVDPNSSLAWTGSVNMGGASTTAPMVSASSAPGTCTVGQFYFNSVSGHTYACTASNTWTQVDGGGSVTAGSQISVSGSTVSFNPLDLTSNWAVINLCDSGQYSVFGGNWQSGGSFTYPTTAPCIATVNSGSAMSDYQRSYMTGSGYYLDFSKTFAFAAKVTAISSISTGQYRVTLGIGFATNCDGSVTTSTCASIAFEPASNAHWILRTCDGTACSITASTVTVATATTYNLMMEQTTPGTVRWFINGVEQTAKSTNVGTGKAGAMVDAENTTGTAVTFGLGAVAFLLTPY